MREEQKKYLVESLDKVSYGFFVLIALIGGWWVVGRWLTNHKIYSGYEIDFTVAIALSIIPLILGVVLKWISGFIKAGLNHE